MTLTQRIHKEKRVMTTAEKISKTVKELPEHERCELLEYAELLRQKQLIETSAVNLKIPDQKEQ